MKYILILMAYPSFTYNPNNILVKVFETKKEVAAYLQEPNTEKNGYSVESATLYESKELTLVFNKKTVTRTEEQLESVTIK